MNIMNKSNKRLNTPPPLSKPPPPTPTPTQQTISPRTLQDSLVSGFGLGFGHSIANKLINGLFSSCPPSGVVDEGKIIKYSSPNDIEQRRKLNSDPYSRTCNYLITELDLCLLLNKDCNNDCNELYEKLKLHECQYELYECKKPKIIYDDFDLYKG